MLNTHLMHVLNLFICLTYDCVKHMFKICLTCVDIFLCTIRFFLFLKHNKIRVYIVVCSVQEMIDGADRDGDGEVNEHEFLRMMKKTYT